MHPTILAFALAWTATAAAAPQSTLQSTNPSTRPWTRAPSHGSHTNCTSGVVLVTATAQNTHLLLPPPTSQLSLSSTIQSLFSRNSTFLQQIDGGPRSVSGNYSISLTLCLPSSQRPESGNVSTIQILTHGIGVSRSYWDLAEGYSYVDAATGAGYAMLAYDRLGSGSSEKPQDAIQVAQAALDAEILHGLIGMLRRGEIGPPGERKRWEKVVGVAHSYGSGVQVGHDARYPNSLDAVAITGFSADASFLGAAAFALAPTVARESDPAKFSGLGNGYVTYNNPVGVQLADFEFGGYDPKLLDAFFATRDTFALGQLLTLARVAVPAVNFTGPVDVVNGDGDYLFCGGDCKSPVDFAAAARRVLYPNADAGGSADFLVPRCGHTINPHRNARLQFEQIARFLKRNGL